MKKFLLVSACALCTLAASAQYASDASGSFFSTQKADRPVTFGIRGGINLAKQTVSSGEYDFSAKNHVGFNVGVCVDIPMLESLYLQSGLYYTVKGYKLEEDGETEKATPAYLEIPVLASYRYNFSNSTQLQINFGPYFAYGVAGKYKWKSDGESENEKYFDNEEEDNKRFDAGLAFGAGITIQHIFVGMNYDLGLANVWKDSEGSIKNKCLSIQVGYNF